MTDSATDEWFIREVLPLEPMLSRLLQRNWRNEAEISDLRQETFARVYEAAQRERPTLVEPFLFQVAHNLMLDCLGRREVSGRSVPDFEWQNALDDEPSKAHVAPDQELCLLQASLDELPTRCRQVVLMRKVEGLSQKEIANEMGITVEEVQNHVAKGIRLFARGVGSRRGSGATEARR